MACDVCGKSCDKMNSLIDRYATNEIKMVCESCEKEINNFIFKARALSNNFIKNLALEFMNEKRKGSGVFK